MRRIVVVSTVMALFGGMVAWGGGGSTPLRNASPGASASSGGVGEAAAGSVPGAGMKVGEAAASSVPGAPGAAAPDGADARAGKDCGAVDAYVRALQAQLSGARVDPRSPGALSQISRGLADLQAKAAAAANDPASRDPLCQARLQGLAGQLPALGTQAVERAGDAARDASDRVACMNRCRESGDPSRMGGCLQSCQR
ncbi:MAG: hypothetical protein RLZZ299_190 [Pseudomonadota bacterium]